MSVVHVYNKARDITYVYESQSYWDKKLKQPRSHRKLIGRLDPVTGEVVPSGGRKKKNTSDTCQSDTDYKKLYEKALTTIEKKDTIITELRCKLSECQKDNKKLQLAIDKASVILIGSASTKELING